MHEMSDRVDFNSRLGFTNAPSVPTVNPVHTYCLSVAAVATANCHPHFSHPDGHSELVAPFEHTYTYTGKGRR